MFFETLAQRGKPGEIQECIEDLFSPVERLMVIKRLAIGILLAKDFAYEEIKEILKVSQATIGKMATILKTKGETFRKVAQRLEASKETREFFDDLKHYLTRGKTLRGRKPTRHPFPF